jgi:EAL domain-containing protein (putative c-di-GMP-specific phosphodiesterase class I)
MIRSIAEAIDGRMRKTDVVARIGGDEFAVIMPATEPEAASEVAHELLMSIRDHGIVLGAQRLRPSVCAGISAFGHDGMDPGDVMVNADLALYAAKAGGRGRVAVHSDDEGTESQEVRIPWSQRIRSGLDDGMFIPYRQPIMSHSDRSITRYELLARMLGEDGMPIAPGAFLPAAERSGLVPEIDKRMALWAIELIALSEAAGEPLSYEVNLSARSLADPDLPPLIAEHVESAGIDPSRLMFEITETAAISNLDQARKVAEVLREVGCQFALDDFGAGFASFLYLKHLPLDALKIDGDFVSNLRNNETDQLLVKYMAQIASDLGLLTIAEYIEDAETLEIVAGYGIDAGQGFHIGRPEPVPGFDGGVTPERSKSLAGRT